MKALDEYILMVLLCVIAEEFIFLHLKTYNSDIIANELKSMTKSRISDSAELPYRMAKILTNGRCHLKPTLYAIPALLMRMSNPPYLSCRYFLNVSILCPEVMSSWWNSGFRPSSFNFFTASIPRPSSRAAELNTYSTAHVYGNLYS